MPAQDWRAVKAMTGRSRHWPSRRPPQPTPAIFPRRRRRQSADFWACPIDNFCIFMQDACNFMQGSTMLRSEPEHNNAPARRTMLAKIIREQNVGRQTELVDLLRKLGHIATQSSVSRDLRELGVAKMGDRYGLPETALTPKNDFSALKQVVNARLTAEFQLTLTQNYRCVAHT